MSSTSEDAMISWLNLRMNLAFVAVSRSWLNDDLIAGMLMSGVFTGNVQHIDSTPEGTRRYLAPGSVPNELRRPVNAMSVAASVGIPRETARTRIKTLIGNGILIESDAGVVLSTDGIGNGPILKVLPGYLGAIDAFLTDLRSISACGLKPGNNFSEPLWTLGGAVLRLGCAHVLRTTNAAQALQPDAPFVTKYVFAALSHLVGLDFRLDETPPATSEETGPFGWELQPVSGAAVARYTGLPDETVRRHLHQLGATATVIRNRDGYDVNLANPPMVRRWRQFQNRSNASTRQFIAKAKAAGLLV